MNRKDIHRLIKTEQVSEVSANSNQFLQFNTTVRDSETNKIDRVVRFSNSELFCLMSKECNAHFDGAFYYGPKDFEQHFVIMVHNEDSQCCMPCLHALMISKFKFCDVLC